MFGRWSKGLEFDSCMNAATTVSAGTMSSSVEEELECQFSLIYWQTFFDKWFWAGVIIICWFVVAHEQICTYQRSFLVYGEFLGKPNVQGQLRMLLSLFFVYTAIYLLNVLQKCYYTFKKIIMHMINSKSLISL